MACRQTTPCAVVALAVGVLRAFGGPELVDAPAAVIRVGDPSPGGFPSEAVTEIRAVEFNNVGGWGALVVSRIALSDAYRHEVYGSPSTDAPFALLRRDATIGAYTQTSFSPRFALGDDGSVLYAATAIHDPTGVEMDTLWRGATLIGDEIVRVAGFQSTYYASFQDLALPADDDPIYATNVSTSPGGAPFNQMLLRDSGNELVFFGTDPIVGISEHAAIGPNILGERLSVTPSGGHWLTTVRLDSPAPRRALVRDGAAVGVSGVHVIEDEPIPAPLGFDGERWGQAVSYDLNDDGRLLLAARTRTGQGAGLETFPCLVLDDEILFQSGDLTSTPGSQTILTNFEAVELNAQGDYACAVSAVEPPNFLMFVGILVNGELVIRSGTPIDWDGDGVPEAGFIRLAPLAPADAMLELSDRDEDDVVRLMMVADTSSGRAVVSASIQLDHPPCPGDLADPPDHVLDFSDVLAFLAYFDDHDPRADLAPPEGVWDFSDIFAFMVAFAAGCP
ncbi:MAG: GC-type dockerin domain-anchored protein [Phycisphaerales bacterium]